MLAITLLGNFRLKELVALPHDPAGRGKLAVEWIARGLRRWSKLSPVSPA